MASTIPSNPTSQTVAALLPKLHDADPDYRFMSLNDLYQVLNNGRPDFLHNDYNTAARAVDGIIKTLDDQNGEVQNLAIKCLAPLVVKIPSTILAPLIEKLSTLSTENSVDNSISAMALRNVVITLPRPVTGVSATKEIKEAYAAVSRVLIPRLIGRLVVAPPASMKLPAAPPAGMLQFGSDKDIDAEAVDVLIEVVRCFGPMLQPLEIEALQEIVVSILENDRATSVVKKRAVVAVSILGVYLSDADLSKFISHLIEGFRRSHLTPVQRRLYITILGSLARSIPARFGSYLKTLAPFVLAALSQQELQDQLENTAENGEADPEVDDVREAALVAVEGFLASCGSEMRPYTEETIDSAVRFLKYDPNYVGDDEDDDAEMGGVESDEDDMDALDEDDDFDADEAYDNDDDDDASWKVRRCAAKVLYTLISTRASGDLLDDGTLYTQVAPVLVNRFNEREQSVRLEVISTMSSLIRKTGEEAIMSLAGDDNLDYMNHVPSRKRRRESSSITFDNRDIVAMSAGLMSPIIEPTPASGPRADLAKISPTLIKAVVKQLKGASIPTKQAVILLLDNMIAVQHGGLTDYLNQLLDPIVNAIKGTGLTSTSSAVATSGVAASATTSTLRIAALRLMSSISETHSSGVLQPHLGKIIPGVIAAVKDKFYKISGEGISTVEQIVKAITPPRARTVDSKNVEELRNLYGVVTERVTANDADVEVRQKAIHALGILLARTAGGEGSKLIRESERTEALDILKERLLNETTRLSAVRAIDTVAALTTSKDQMSVNWIREVSLELSAQLRKADRALRSASLGALKNLIISPPARKSLDKSTVEGLVGALLPLLTSADLHLLGPSLLVFAALVEDDAKLVVTPQLVTALCSLLTGTVGGAVLDAMLVLVKTIGEQGSGANLMKGLLQDVSVNGDPVVVGKVIGTLLVSGGPSVGVTIDSFLSELKSNTDEARQSLALTVLGEAGLRMGDKSQLTPDVFIRHFDSKSSKVSLSAAVALGRAGAGSISRYLPLILDMVSSGGNSQYLVLHSIKEILQQDQRSSTDIRPFAKSIWDKLMLASRAEDNKAVAAECIGRLAIVEPKTYLPQLQQCLVDKTASIRAMAIQALRYTLPDGDDAYDAALKTCLVDVLNTMMHDQELDNRRLALTTLNSAAHNKPELILGHMTQLLPLVIDETIIKPELVHEVMMGPFKHKVDDGMDVRKSAYETLYSLMETSFSRINILSFYDRIIAGLSDEHDIRSLCNLMLTKLVVLDLDETARRLDSIADCFRSILSTKLKDNAVKQEIEKQDEAVKGVLRVTLLLHNAIPSASTGMATGAAAGHQTWRAYWEWVEKDFDQQLRLLRDESRAGATSA